MSPSQNEFLSHILDECNYLIREHQTNTYEDFIRDERLVRAICRSLEIIGEASKKINSSMKLQYPSVPWREMGDIRNKIIHNYFGVDYDIVWDIVETDIPYLKEWISRIIEKGPE